MLFLPEQADAVDQNWEKIYTNMLLYKMGCPIYKSAVVTSQETIDAAMVSRLRRYFGTDDVMIRYQYITPNHKPIQTGNRHKLTAKALSEIQDPDTVLWMTEPINRLENEYGINLRFVRSRCAIEIVGRGFDASDLTRGRVSPQEIVTTELPVQMGVYNEWWKFLTFAFQRGEEYQSSKKRRLQKLTEMGYAVSDDIFPQNYQPLPFGKLEELLHYISSIYDFMEEDDFCVASSIYRGSYVFWDIQTARNKMRRYGI